MNTGYLLLMLLGLLWTGIAIVVSEARRRDCPTPQFYLAGSLAALAILACVTGMEGLRSIFAPDARTATLCFFLGSLFNGAGQAVSMMNLKQGGRALAYAIPQQAFLFPYVWSIFFWGQRIGALSVAGIALIVLAVFYLSSARGGDGSSSLPARRIAVALGAMTLMGISQIILITPTQLPGGMPTASAAACVIMGANVCFFLAWSLLVRRGFAAFGLYLPLGGAWGLLAAASYSTLLPALALLGKIGQSGIVFPVGAGMLILLYSAFTSLRYREKLDWRQKCAFAALVCGICGAKLG